MLLASLFPRRHSRSLARVHRPATYRCGSLRPATVEVLEERTLLSAGDLDPTLEKLGKNLDTHKPQSARGGNVLRLTYSTHVRRAAARVCVSNFP